MYPASTQRAAAPTSSNHWIIRPLAISALAMLAAAPCLRAATETLPNGTYVIAMDNTLQGSGGNFNLRAYGLAVRLLHAGVPLKWVIEPAKTKDGIDFTANASRIAPSAAASASRDFRAGPIAVHPGYETEALAVITSFNAASGTDVNVYQLSQNATVNVAETLVHKPKVATISQGGDVSIHTDIFAAAGMLSGVHYETITNPASLNGSSCYTVATEPHNSLKNITATVAANVKTFVQSGGNFLGQCESVESYTTRGLLSGFSSKGNLGGTMTFDNHGEPYAQFQGGLTDEGGSVTSFKLTSDPGKRIAYSSTDGANYKAYVGRIDGFTGRSGGYVHYLAGHNYKGTGITDINGKRMLLNAVLRSADRPFGCGITINADLAIVKTVNNATPNVGSQVTFTLQATNNGPSPATGVTVADPLPSGYTFVSANPAAAYDSNGGTWTIGSLACGATTSLTISATVNPSGTYLNTAIISGDQTDPDPCNNTDDASTTPVAQADLAIVKNVNNATPNVGSQVSFTLQATNNGPSPATGVSVADPLPDGYTFVSAIPASAYDSGTGAWTIGSLASGASTSLTITATVNPCGNYLNTATIGGEQNDPNPDNNSDDACTTPVPQADLAIVKTVDNATPNVGSQVTFTLLANNHGPSDATGVSVADPLPDGYTFVSANPAAAYDSGSGAWTIGSLASGASTSLTITASVNSSGSYLNTATIGGDQTDPNPGNNTDNASTTPVPHGAISGTVWMDTDNDNIGDTPIEGVILSLVDGSCNPVLDENNQPVTTVTAADGTYTFADLPAGTCGVVQTQPAGMISLFDQDGGNPDEILPINVLAGHTNSPNDFVEMSLCPDTWADWKQLHPGETAQGNPDADAYDNFAEFAFAMPYDRGTGSEWLGSTAWVIQPSTTIEGTIEAVFVRPKGAYLNVTYTLQYAATLCNPTVWTDIVIDTGITGNATTVDNGDCTETVTLHDLETLTGLTGGEGFVRIKADLDDDGGNNGDIDHTSYTEVEGWTCTDLEICCRTFNTPYQRETAFTGTITAVNGRSLVFAAADNLDTLLAPGSACYLEVTSGDREGQRFDVVFAAANTITVANDTDLNSPIAPFNATIDDLPADLVGDTLALRRHWTLNEVFPPAGFGATNSQSSADQVQVFSGGAWTIYWLYDENDADPLTSRWVSAADAGMADQGAVVIPPGQGVFFNNRTAATSILAYGEVRANDFIRPLAVGNNLVGGGYPLSQSANGPGGRAMNIATGFFSSRDFKTADSIFIWKADTMVNAPGYDTYYLADARTIFPGSLRWVKVGDPTLAIRDADVVLHGNRAAFVRSRDGVPQYTVPSPWTP
jgi:uncharacterized repeat protein (TIGR01451 family)